MKSLAACRLENDFFYLDLFVGRASRRMRGRVMPRVGELRGLWVQRTTHYTIFSTFVIFVIFILMNHCVISFGNYPVKKVVPHENARRV